MLAGFGATMPRGQFLVIASVAKQSSDLRHGSPRRLRLLAMTKVRSIPPLPADRLRNVSARHIEIVDTRGRITMADRRAAEEDVIIGNAHHFADLRRITRPGLLPPADRKSVA